MKEITALGQTGTANSKMLPWHIAATTAVTQTPQPLYFQSSFVYWFSITYIDWYIDSLLETPDLHPQNCALSFGRCRQRHRCHSWLLPMMPLILATLLPKGLQLKEKKISALTFACCKPINLYIKPRVNWSDPLITTENQEELKESQDSTEHNKSTPKMLDCFLFPRDFPYKLNINSVSKSQKGSLSPKVDSND